ncbi:MAG: hypothetical protein EP330_06805 [Deltaproteobacteria bacterium]|nr:MAG: hypothetical protein EP330_06805 [Deltaproteobacteria bacterium]
MSACALCGEPADQRFSGLDLCAVCLTSDPSAALAGRGVPAEFARTLGAFNAGLGIPGAPADFRLQCVPEMLHHKAMKLFSSEVQVGDPSFDQLVYVRTSDAATARSVLASEGVQSALIGLLRDTRANDLRGSHVTLEGPTLTVQVVPRQVMLTDEDEYRRYELETAALALHLTARFVGG